MNADGERYLQVLRTDGSDRRVRVPTPGLERAWLTTDERAELVRPCRENAQLAMASPSWKSRRPAVPAPAERYGLRTLSAGRLHD